MEQNYPSFPPRLFLSTGIKEKTGNEVTFDSQVSDAVDGERQRPTWTERNEKFHNIENACHFVFFAPSKTDEFDKSLFQNLLTKL